MPIRTKVFISYSHKDERYLRALLPHLEFYEQNGDIEYWADTKIKPGEDWRRSIEKALTSTRVAVLLVSADFLTSTFIKNNELPPILTAAVSEGVTVLIVILRPCNLPDSLSRFQAVNSPSRSVSELKGPQRERLWVKVANAIDDAVKEKPPAPPPLVDDAVKEERPVALPPIVDTVKEEPPVVFPPPLIVDTVREERPVASSPPAKLALPPEETLQRTTPAIPQTKNLPVDTKRASRSLTSLLRGSEKKSLYVRIAAGVLVLLVLFSLIAFYLIPILSGGNGIHIEQVTISENNHNDQITIGIADGKRIQFEKSAQSAEACIDGANPTDDNNAPTVIVVTTLSKTYGDNRDSLNIGDEDLQGICLWQKYFQKYNHTREPLRILIANIGTKEPNVLDTTVPQVTTQIIQFAASYRNFLGVIGFSFSQSVLDAMDRLNKAHIPVISPAASSADFSGEWAYFNRVIPSNQSQGSDAAKYVKKELKVNTAFVFFDTTNPYSQTLGNNFMIEFGSEGSSAIPEPYTVSNSSSFDKGIRDVLTRYRGGSAVVFCACYASDFIALRDKMQTSRVPEGVIFMGGEGLYELGSYSGNYKDIYFTAYAYPDTIKILCQGQQALQCTQEQTQFLADYCHQFDPQDYRLDPANLQHCGYYGISRPGPHVIQTYDAISALLKAYNQAKKTVQAPSKEDIQQALNQLSFEGISGQIDFTSIPQGDPNDKAILVLCVDSNHHTHLVGVYGQFFQSNSHPNNSQGPQFFSNSVCV